MFFRVLLLCQFPLFLLAQNTLDQNSLKQGKWTKNHPNGKLRYVGMFKNDIPIGIFKHYDTKGRLTVNLEYFNEGQSAAARLYHQMEKLVLPVCIPKKKRQPLEVF